MFLIDEPLNEGKTAAKNAKYIKPLHSEGQSPKSSLAETKLSNSRSTRYQSSVNLNWQKLRS